MKKIGKYFAMVAIAIVVVFFGVIFNFNENIMLKGEGFAIGAFLFVSAELIYARTLKERKNALFFHSISFALTTFILYYLNCWSGYGWLVAIYLARWAYQIIVEIRDKRNK